MFLVLGGDWTIIQRYNGSIVPRVQETMVITMVCRESLEDHTPFAFPWYVNRGLSFMGSNTESIRKKRKNDEDSSPWDRYIWNMQDDIIENTVP